MPGIFILVSPGRGWLQGQFGQARPDRFDYFVFGRADWLVYFYFCQLLAALRLIGFKQVKRVKRGSRIGQGFGFFGAVAAFIQQDDDFRLRDIADVVGITERAVHRIVSDLTEAGFIDVKRDGRCNVYVMHPEKKMRHPVEAHRQVADLIQLIENE